MSIFLDKAEPPDEQRVARALGRTDRYWKALKAALVAAHGPLIEEWKYYGKTSGWTLKLLLKKRNLFFFAPYNKFFRVAFVFGDKAVSAIEKSDLPAAMIRELLSAKRYAEGRGLRIDVTKGSSIAVIVTLVEYKIQY